MSLEIIWDERWRFVTGFLNTVWLCVFATVASLLLGILVTIPMMSRHRVLRGIARGLVDSMRAIPFLLLVYLVYYGLPSLGVTLDSWTTALTVLVAYNSAYTAEILRGAWAHLPREQSEAGYAFGFRGVRLFRTIILPQVAIAAGPVIGNQMIGLIKDSAFLSIITVPELTFEANFVHSVYYVPFAPFLVALVLYWALCSLVEVLVQRLERFAALRRDAYVKA